MQAQMTGVDVTGQNLANVSTTGYTRQTVDIQTSPDISTSIGDEGTGANAVAIQQAVNSMLNGQIVTQQSSSSYWSAQQSALQSLQTNLDEFLNGTASTSSNSTDSTTDTGLAGQLSSLFDDFQAVATSPTSISARQELISQAQTLSSTFNQVDSQFNATRTSLNSSLTNDVSSANQLLTGIAQLNGQISSAEFSGGTPNDLLDERHYDEWLDLFGREEEAVAWLAHHAKLPARVVVQYDGKLNVVLKVLLDGLDHRYFAGQGHIDNVCLFLRP